MLINNDLLQPQIAKSSLCKNINKHNIRSLDNPKNIQFIRGEATLDFMNSNKYKNDHNSVISQLCSYY